MRGGDDESRDAPLRVLMIDDNPGDVLLVREALAELGLEVALGAVHDVDTAMARLQACVGPAGAQCPDLILLDLNLPRGDGCEVLRFIRSRPQLRGLPVVGVSSSQAEADRNEVRLLQAAGYLCKPVDFEAYVRLVDELRPLLQAAAARPAGGGEC